MIGKDFVPIPGIRSFAIMECVAGSVSGEVPEAVAFMIAGSFGV
jgi:hypothetical protein